MVKGRIQLHRRRVNGERQFFAVCPRHRKPVEMRGYGPQGGLGSYNGVMMMAAVHRRAHEAADAKKAAKAAAKAKR